MGSRVSAAVEHENIGMRADQFLAQQLGISRSQAQLFLAENRVSLFGRQCSAAYKVKVGEVFSVQLPEPAPTNLLAQSLPLNILHADDDIIVIDKSAGMVVHPSAGHPDGTMVNALLYLYPEIVIGSELRPGIVHRLDKDTSGVMVCARNNRALEHLMRSFKDRQVEKTYRAFCWGVFDNKSFELKTGHRRHGSDRKKFTTKVKIPENGLSSNGNRFAHSHIQVSLSNENVSELTVRLFTGRTHQIRAHLADIGHPLLKDELYGGMKNLNKMTESSLKTALLLLKRHALHSESLAFVHPTSRELVRFTAPLPEDLGNIHAALQG